MSLHFLFMFCLSVFTPQKFVRATPLTSSKGIFQHFAFMLITKWRNQWRFNIVTWRQFNHTIFEGVIGLFDFGKCATPSTFEMELPQNFEYFLITI